MAATGSAFPCGKVAPGLPCSSVNTFVVRGIKKKKVTEHGPQTRYESPSAIIPKQLAYFVHKSAKVMPVELSY